MKRTEIKRKTPLKATRWGLSDKPRQALPAVNEKAKSKRSKNMRTHYASPEYKAAKLAQLEHAGHQCETLHVFNTTTGIRTMVLPGELTEPLPPTILVARCTETERLEFHETEYGSDVGIIREIAGVIVCPPDHQFFEMTRHWTRHIRRTR